MKRAGPILILLAFYFAAGVLVGGWAMGRTTGADPAHDVEWTPGVELVGASHVSTTAGRICFVFSGVPGECIQPSDPLHPKLSAILDGVECRGIP